MALAIDRLLGKGRGVARIEGADGLSVALVFSRNQAALEKLELALDKDRSFTIADTRRFNVIMNQLYYDSPIHFGSSRQWQSLMKVPKPIPRGVTRVFHANPEAARALLEEMANRWASDEAKTAGHTGMTNAAVFALIDAHRADPEKIMQLIGSRYAAGHYYQAALALQRSQALAMKFAKKIIKAKR